MAPFSAGSSLTYHLTCHLAPFVLIVITTSLPCILPLVMFLKAVFSALYPSSCTLPLSVLLSFPFPLTTNSYADDTQFFFSFHPLNFDSSISHLQNALQQIFFWMTVNLLLLTPLRLNSCSSDSKTYLSNTQLFTWHFSHSPKSWLHHWWTSYIPSLKFSDQITSKSPKPVTTVSHS